MADIVALLGNTLSPDAGTRSAATSQLEQLSATSFPQYLLSLSQVLADNANSPGHVRNAAGLALKNTLTARESARLEQYAARWREQLDDQTRTTVKEASIQTLASADRQARSVAGQVVAAIAAIELPNGGWNDLIARLLAGVNQQENTGLRMASLQAIGYVCEGTRSEVLATQSNEILTAVVQGARKEEPSQEVQLAALVALLNSLEFIRANFEREGERNYIMQVVCESTQSAHSEVQVAGYECLVKIMQLYYDKMRFYMEKALFGLTVNGMKSDNEDVSLQAVEFWSTVCEEEIELQIEASEYGADELEGADGETAPRQSHNFARVALPEILPVILQLLTKQEEDATEDEWNVSMAAGTCLSLLAQTVGDSIVVPIIPFVEANIRNGDWHFREAAVMAFGSILDGPEPKLLTPLVTQALPTLIEMMVKDPELHVKDTTAWTLGRISDVLIDTVKSDIHLPGLVQALVQGMNDSPRIVGNCCWGIMNLVEQVGSQDPIDTSPMSPYYEGIVEGLLRTANRETNEANSRTSCYEALSTLSSYSANDTLPAISKLCLVVLERAEQLLSVQDQIVGSDDRNNYNELQINFCGVLTNIIRRLGKEIRPLSDRIMTLLLSLISSSARSSPILEDAFLCVGAMASTLEGDFQNYVGAFLPYLSNALNAHEEYTLCSIGVGLIGDICRALGERATPYAQGFMEALMNNLRSSVLHRSVKPPILSCFGDIALAVGPQGFEPFLEATMTVLAQAGSMKADPTNYDIVEYVNTLREAILEAYTGVVSAFKQTPRSAALVPYLESVFGFLRIAMQDVDRTEGIVKAGVGLLGDLASEFQKGEIKQPLQEDWVQEAIKVARTRGSGSETRQVAKWAKEMVRLATR